MCRVAKCGAVVAFAACREMSAKRDKDRSIDESRHWSVNWHWPSRNVGETPLIAAAAFVAAAVVARSRFHHCYYHSEQQQQQLLVVPLFCCGCRHYQSLENEGQ